MRKLAAAAALVCLALTTPLAGQDDPGPVEVVHDLFVHMKAGNADAMAGLMHDEVRLITTGERDGIPVARVVDVDGWLEGVGSSERVLDERLYDVEVRIEGGLASVWARYDLYVDGMHSHCGVDSFQLVRTEAGWRIIEIADTRTREGCRGS